MQHYFLPYWEKLDWMEYPESNKKFCSGNKANVDINLDVGWNLLSLSRLPALPSSYFAVRRNVRKYGSGTRQFQYIYFTEISHTHEYDVERTDRIFLDFFKVVMM